MKTLVDSASVLVAGMPVGPFAMNQYLVGCKATGAAAIIDAGAAPEPFLDFAAAHGLRVEAIFQTHAHIDHVAGLAATRAKLAAPIYLHPADGPLYANCSAQGAMMGFPCPAPPPVDHALQEGQVLSLGTLRFEVLHTPGHAPGHVVLWERGQEIAFVGDLIFFDSIGRTDLPLCDGEAMERSLGKLAATLPDPTRLFPGHMQDTTMGRERRSNPFLKMMGLA